jgi:DnaD/phage-associated family protein
MAKYRQVHIDFWQDGFVLDLTPEEKYFYLYLMTNSKTAQCGIYELPKRIIETETGYNRETVNKLIQRFVDYGKIEYNDSTREIYIKNWIKFNWIQSNKVLMMIDKELKKIKHEPFLEKFFMTCIRNGYRIDTLSIYKAYEKHKEDVKKTVEHEENHENDMKTSQDSNSIPYPYGIDTLGKDYGEEREREREVEREQEQEREVNALTIFWDNNGFGEDNHYAKKSLLSFENEFDFDDFDSMAFKAMNIACEANKRTISYVKGILNNWNKQGIKNLQQLEEQANKQSYKQQDKKPHDPSMDQYKKLLG